MTWVGALIVLLLLVIILQLRGLADSLADLEAAVRHDPFHDEEA
jgi:hypothetical protein